MLPNKNESGNSYRGYVLLDPNNEWIVVQDIEEGVGITLTRLNDRNHRVVCLKRGKGDINELHWNHIMICIILGKFTEPDFSCKTITTGPIPAKHCAFAM